MEGNPFNPLPVYNAATFVSSEYFCTCVQPHSPVQHRSLARVVVRSAGGDVQHQAVPSEHEVETIPARSRQGSGLQSTVPPIELQCLRQID